MLITRKMEERLIKPLPHHIMPAAGVGYGFCIKKITLIIWHYYRLSKHVRTMQCRDANHTQSKKLTVKVRKSKLAEKKIERTVIGGKHSDLVK